MPTNTPTPQPGWKALTRRTGGISAGKDSLVQLHRIATWAEKAGCLHKVVVIHIDLGEESEWPGVRELAQRQAERYGLRFHVPRAEGGLLGLVEKRGMWRGSW